MDWQQKAAALDALAEIQIMIRGVGDWYVHQNVQIRKVDVLFGEYGNGETPVAAIEDHWQKLVNEVSRTPHYLVARDGSGTRRAVRWNGFMWADVPEPKAAA